MTNRHSNYTDLENKNVKSLIWQYGLPAIIGTTVNAVYNIINRFFISRADYLGENAMTAIGIVLPIMTIMTAFGMLIGVGSASRISIYMGQNDKKSAEQILGNAVILQFLITLVVSLLLWFNIDPIINLLGANEKTYPFAHEFLFYYTPFSILSSICFSFNNMMRASGYPKKAMYTMLLTVFVNIILAPIFIFYFKWGMMGAAFATISAMFVGSCFVMYHFMNKNSDIRIYARNIRINVEKIKAIISIGMSPFMIQLLSSIIVTIIVRQLQKYGGQVEVAAYIINNAFILMIVMVITGLTQGMQPIVGYNYGAKRFDRVNEALVYTIKVAVGFGAIAFIVGVIFPFLIVDLFKPSDTLKVAAEHALRMTTFMSPLIAFQIVITSFFQSIGKAKIAIFLSLIRQMIIFIPFVFILPHLFGLQGVWSTFPLSDFLATFITFIIFLRQFRAFKHARERQ